MRTRLKRCQFVLAAMWASNSLAANSEIYKLEIPEVKSTEKRPITIDDIVSLRIVDSLSVSPDGQRFAVFVRQGDAAKNSFRTGLFVGGTSGGSLTSIGHGGELRPNARPTGQTISGSETRWSPNGQWIAYTLDNEGAIQLWRSRADGSQQEQISMNAADVREFAWSDDNSALYFTTAPWSRAEQASREEARARNGFSYDDDLWTFTEFMAPAEHVDAEVDHPIWIVTLEDKLERPAAQSETAAFRRAKLRDSGGIETTTSMLGDDAVSPSVASDGRLAWLERSAPYSEILRLTASQSNMPAAPRVACGHLECTGAIKRIWWSKDSDRVLFWRGEGINSRIHAFYSWSPSTDQLELVSRTPDDDYQYCTKAADDRVICVRETPTRPHHLAVVEFPSGRLTVVADVNPEFTNIRLGRIERFEWDTPRFDWNERGGGFEGLYPSRAYGYVLYPPNFDPRKKYPVFIEPYIAHGFVSTYLSEQALHVYAANGFVVLNTEFPAPTDVVARLGSRLMKDLYSAELDFPHLTMLMKSTVRALDTIEARGFIDRRRVGIGGVSHGSFVPMYMLQKHDRIAAISLASPGWGGHEYYAYTKKGRDLHVTSSGEVGYEEWKPRPEGHGEEFWDRIDLADNIETIEAPMLFNLTAAETFSAVRLIRHLADADKPYDAYVFPNETHVKWQPAHLYSIFTRNLDWFRFWLQDFEEPIEAKNEQYARWRKLREQQCRNPRSLRIYCAAIS